MTAYAEAAHRLRVLITFLEKEGIPLPGTELTGNLGEWLVMDKLIEQGHEPTLFSSQHDYDIGLVDGTRIEVKSGRYDPERSLWRFDRIYPNRFDILVVVKFEEGFEQEVFYVFSEEEVSDLPPRTRSNPDDDARIVRLREDPTRHRRPDMQSLNKRITKHRGTWDKLPT